MNNAQDSPNGGPMPMPQGGTIVADPRYYQLDERVTNLRSSVSHLETQMQNGFNSLSASVNNLSEQLRSGQRTQWPVIWMAAAVVITVLGGLGALLYTPVKNDLTKLQESTITRNEWNDFQHRGSENRQRFELAIAKLAENAVTQSDMVPLMSEYRDYKMRIEDELKNVDATKLNRNEWIERNQSRDHDIENLRSSMISGDVNLQRQIDQQNTEFEAFAGSLGNGRDVLQRLQTEYDRLRDRVAELTSLLSARSEFRSGRSRMPEN